jgi:polar amino acid transport system substrate-binding protein
MELNLKLLFVFISFYISTSQANSGQEIDIFYPEFSHLLEIDKETNNHDPDYLKIVKYLSATGLNYNFYAYPWKRALFTVNKSPNALIVFLDRTPKRENSYHWLLKLGSKKDYVFGPANISPKHQNSNTFKLVKGAAVCIRGSEQCKLFRKLGFDEHNLIITSSPDMKAHDLVKKGRGKFFIADKRYMEQNNHDGTLMPQNYKALFIVSDTSIYMAAPMSIDPNLLKRLSTE